MFKLIWSLTGVKILVLMENTVNVYPQDFLHSTINSKGSSHPSKAENRLGSLYITHVKCVSQKFKNIGNRYNIKIFRAKHDQGFILENQTGRRSARDSAVCLYCSL